MKRRRALSAMGALALTPFAPSGKAAEKSGGQLTRRTTTLKQHQSSVAKIVLGDSHFLSTTNPIATVDQRDMEAQALKLLQLPIIRQANAQAALAFKVLAGRDLTPEALLDFDDKMEEWAFHYLLLAGNSDPNYPKVLGSIYSPAHEWFGMKVPGSRGPCTPENADNNYSIIPVDGYAHFELHGQRLSPAIGDCTFYINADITQAVPLNSLLWHDVRFEPDGSFVITIGPEPADGRPNHLQTNPEARFLLIRDSRIDWRQVPNAYRVWRLDPPTARPLTTEEVTKRASLYITDDVGKAFMLRQFTTMLDSNTITAPQGSGPVGGQPSQKSARSYLKLANDEAFVLTLDPGGSEYWVLMVYDFWFMSGDFWNKTSSMNNTQSVANPDGSYTYVISIHDPGVHNWINTLGLHEFLFWVRLHLLPGSAGGPSTKGQLVKLKDIDSVLPAATKRVTPDERRQQLAERLETFKLRYVV